MQQQNKLGCLPVAKVFQASLIFECKTKVHKEDNLSHSASHAHKY
jgi:hypothetical protein